MSAPPPRAVIFDLGGVVLDSPLDAVARFERAHGIPAGHINRVVLASGPDGAWSRLERGALSLGAFCQAFDAECRAAGHPISSRALMAEIGASATPRPAMLRALRAIRARGLRTAALTNNWHGDRLESAVQQLAGYFDVAVESAREGVRKPDPRIYQRVCERLGVAPGEAIFLDDIGRNLKTARALGMTTIKVVDAAAALGELEALLGFSLADGDGDGAQP